MKKISLISRLLVLFLVLSLSLTGCREKEDSSEPTLQEFSSPDCNPTYKVTITDDGGLIYDKPTEEYFASGTVLKLHSDIICDADLGMYVNGEFYAVQDAVDTGSGYIWEYIYEVGREDVLIEFKIIGGKESGFEEVKQSNDIEDEAEFTHIA